MSTFIVDMIGFESFSTPVNLITHHTLSNFTDIGLFSAILLDLTHAHRDMK